MLTTTYGESVISMPTFEIGPPTGPMENGTTYMVRPRILPAKTPANVRRISSGAHQLLVGPASISRSEQMKVAFSTRATSAGSERARKEFGRSCWFSRMKVPPATSCSLRRSRSSSLPSHHTTASGRVRSATSATNCWADASPVGVCWPGLRDGVGSADSVRGAGAAVSMRVTVCLSSRGSYQDSPVRGSTVRQVNTILNDQNRAIFAEVALWSKDGGTAVDLPLRG